MRRAPASNAMKLARTGGSSVPPMTPSELERVREPAIIPARYDASSKAKFIPATFGATLVPDVVM